MKTIDKILLCASSAFVLLSCAKEIEAPVENELVQKTFIGYADASLTKTSLASDYSVLWTAKDAVSVFAGDENKKFTVSNLQDGNKTATLEGLVSFAEQYYALYPYNENASMSGSVIKTVLPTVQKAVAGTFAQEANLSVAKTADDKLYFRNAGAIVGFSVEANGLTSVTLSSRTGELPISGDVEIDAAGDEPVMTVTGTASAVKLEGNFEAGQKYYFVVAPGTYKGLALTFENSSLEAACVKQHAADVEILRNSNKWLGNFVISDSDWVASEYRSYVINGKDEVDAFVAGKGSELETVINLTVTGRGVTSAELRGITERVGEIRGTLTLDGIGTENTGDWLDSQNFLERIDCKGSIVFRNIVNIINPNGFKNKPYTKINGDLIIENCPQFCTDWGIGTGLDVIKEVAGNLVLKGFNKMSGTTLNDLKIVGGNLEISGMSGVWSLKNGMQVERVGGDLVIQDNVSLWSLHGFEKLIHVGGNVVVFNNNPKMPRTNSIVDGDDCIGYCLIKDLKEMGAIRQDATIRLGKTGDEINVDDLQSCEPDKPKSYVIAGQEALIAFIEGKGDAKEVVDNLYISGADISEGKFRDIDERVSAIIGTLTMESLGTSDSWISTDQVLENIDIQGSIIMRNIPAHINPNGLRPAKLTGDVILEDCPQFPTDWEPFTTLTEVGGSIIVRGNMKGFGSKFFPVIEKIGGDFIMEDLKNGFWDFKSNTLREIGGDLAITGCPYFENFLGFDKLTKLGGNVTIIKPAGGSDWLPESDYGTNKVGLCIFKGYKMNGVMNPDATIKAIGRAGAGNDWIYNVDNLTPCGPGFSE